MRLTVSEIEEMIMAGELEPDVEHTALHHRFWTGDPSRPDKSRAQHHKVQTKDRYIDERAYRDSLEKDL